MVQFYENQPPDLAKGLSSISASLPVLHISSEVTIACISPSQVTSHENYILLQKNEFLLESGSGSSLVQVRPLRPSFIPPSKLTVNVTRSPGPFFFSSPEQKLRVSYCHPPLSVVHRRLFSVVRLQQLVC